jgi:hypothetical protein
VHFCSPAQLRAVQLLCYELDYDPPALGASCWGHVLVGMSVCCVLLAAVVECLAAVLYDMCTACGASSGVAVPVHQGRAHHVAVSS